MQQAHYKVIYPKNIKILIQKGICTTMISAALFAIARHGNNLSAQQ